MSENTGLRHPFTKALYERAEEGSTNIRITTLDGKSGVFQRDGQWLSGDVRECDPQMCNWIGGPRRVSHRMQADHD